jgi:hypothetical protein
MLKEADLAKTLRDSDVELSRQTPTSEIGSFGEKSKAGGWALSLAVIVISNPVIVAV